MKLIFGEALAFGGQVQKCHNGACDLVLDLERRSKFRCHEISIGIAAFSLAPTSGGLLVFRCLPVCFCDYSRWILLIIRIAFAATSAVDDRPGNTDRACATTDANTRRRLTNGDNE